MYPTGNWKCINSKLNIKVLNAEILAYKKPRKFLANVHISVTSLKSETCFQLIFKF